MPTGTLTPKQALFVREYLIDRNGTQAAIRAGYSVKTANEQASRLLTKVNIKALVDAAQDKACEKLGLSAEWVLEKIKSDVVRSSDVENYSSPNLLKGCELLGKHLKLFTDKVELAGELNITHDQWVSQLED